MFRTLRVRLAVPVTVLLVALLSNPALVAQRPAAAPAPDTQVTAAEPERDNSVVHSLNGAKGDVTIKGGGGLVVSTAGNAITVSAPAALAVGREGEAPDPAYALDIGGTGIVRIGNSIFLNGVDNTLSTSTGTLTVTSTSGTTPGVISADGSGLINVPFGSLTAGVNANQFHATNPANSFRGLFIGNLSGNATSATTANIATTANALAPSAFGDVYHFTNNLNTFRGKFTGDGSALTGVTTSGLAPGPYTNTYQFTSSQNTFAGSFTGNLDGKATTATLADNATSAANAINAQNATHAENATNATSATTAETATTLAGGPHTAPYSFSNISNAFTGNGTGLTNVTAKGLLGGNFGDVYHFTNELNTFRGKFTGDGSGLTGVTTSGLAPGPYANTYQFTSSQNTFSGSFTGDLNGNAATATLAHDATNSANATHAENATHAQNAANAANATTAETATTLAGGPHSAAYNFSSPQNVFVGNGAALTGVKTSGLADGDYTGTYTFDNLANSFTGTFNGDGSLLTNVPAVDPSRVLKAGDTMTGLLTLAAAGLQFGDGSEMTTAGWSFGGNANLNGDQFVGTTDNSPLQFRVNNKVALRMEYPSSNLSETPNLIGGHVHNSIEPGKHGGVIGGGGDWNSANQIDGHYGTIGGGRRNRIDSDFSVVAGGDANRAGRDNSCCVFDIQPYAAVSGGLGNTAAGYASSVAGGADNLARGSHASVAGGALNAALGDNTFVAGGTGNTAEGHNSFVAGKDAWARDDNSVVFNDGTAALESQVFAEFVVRASGGFRFLTSNASSVGARLSSGTGSWSSLSDRNVKKNLEAVDAESVLSAVARMPLWRWSYKTQADGIRHMGPTSQDFRAAFGLGEDDVTISVVDADGVNLAAIQALEKRTVKLQEENTALKTEIENLRSMQRQMMQRLDDMVRQRQ